jgi:hypothetical protein
MGEAANVEVADLVVHIPSCTASQAIGVGRASVAP